jgi:hypothetical protein
MRIAVLTKRHWGFCAVFRNYAERRGHEVASFDLTNLAVDDTLGEFDLVVLKSKQLFFLYAGFHAKALGVAVVPEPQVCKQICTRIESPFLAARAGIATPRFYFASPKALREGLAARDFPLVRKRIVGSGSVGVELIRCHAQLPQTTDQHLYLEEFVPGQHLLVYFIEDVIRAFEKQPFVSGREPVRPIGLPDDVASAVERWKRVTGLEFGHLDFVRDDRTNAPVLVDSGPFPQFWHWPEAAERVSSIVLRHLR